ncbi:ABC transporter substrate-binding protein [Agrobacterium vitis]|uniref:ABC transporter substrate-binding protein n=1 Tax=Agrobacterium vitis TaxID=373 RepID=UPI00157328E6|nr:ABC transporter substrate-binding protein [Agrobacterium vitis]NSZ19915.1 ABC transporter substrate-binding protein [Agrobacterium vitis]QZO07606.1 ABC transporter substrate-binding protein [Agrobacterium vitis]UJL90801.1 ABC transporter substrate-binding protein [Agrobacterium vitis]
MTRRLQSLIGSCVLAMFAMIGTSEAATTVTFWHTFSKGNGEALGKIIANFETVHPDIHVEAEFVGNYNDVVARLQAAIPARRAPDAVILEITRYGLFANNNILTDLTPYFEADPMKNDLYDFAREVGVINGKNYVVPFNSSTPVLYFNKDIFARAGLSADTPLKTFDDVLAAAKTIQDKLGSEGISGITAPGQFARWGLVMANNSELIDPRTNEILLDKPNTIEAYQWMASLVSEHKVASPDGVTDEDKGNAAFMAGKVGIDMDSTGSYGGIRKALGDQLIVKPMPCNKICSVPIGGAGIGIMASSPRAVQDAAYTFVSYAASPEANAIWFAATGYLPINKKSAALPVAVRALETQPGIDVAIGSLPYAHGRARSTVVTWMRTTEYKMWQAMALGQRNVDETLKDFAAQTRMENQRAGN